MNTPVVELLRQKSLKRAAEGEFFKLASGKLSKTYMDVRRSALSPEGHHILGSFLLIRLLATFPQAEAVAGVELGGCPLASAVSMLSVRNEGALRSLEALYVRKKAKEHGTGNLVEGNFTTGMKVVLLEDVVTSGGSSIRAIQSLKDAGVDVLGVIAVLDREEGAEEAFAKEGIILRSLTTMREVLGE